MEVTTSEKLYENGQGNMVLKGAVKYGIKRAVRNGMKMDSEKLYENWQ